MKIDLKRDRKDLYQPGAGDFVEVVVPLMSYLAIDGHGDPNTSQRYADAVAALYATAYAVKMRCRQRSGVDFVVGPLEGLWTSGDPASFTGGRKDEWDWTMLIPLPDAVADDDVQAGRAKAAEAKPALPVADVRVLVLEEGRSLQIMHVGSYDDEAPTLARLHDEVMPARGVTFNGAHHEIYLSDPRRVAPERLRTVLRQPVADAAVSPTNS